MADEPNNTHDAVPQILRSIQERLAVTERVQLETLNILKDVAGSVTAMANSVATISKVQEQHGAALDMLTRGQKIVEGELRVIRARVERIEEHTGLVKV